mgnify:CR=1 FL=1
MMIMKEPLYIDCHTSKIKVTTINGQSEQSEILLRANENSEQKQANCHRRKEMFLITFPCKLPQAQGNVISNQVESG